MSAIDGLLRRLANFSAAYSLRPYTLDRADIAAVLELGKERDRLDHENRNLLTTIGLRTHAMKDLEKENAELRRALAFYADERNWFPQEKGCPMGLRAITDRGDRARLTLGAHP